jgi:hypothetical protein
MTAHLIAPPPQPSHGKVARKHLGPLRENLIANEPAAFPFFSHRRLEQCRHNHAGKFVTAGELLALYFLSEELQDVANPFDTSTFLAGDRKGATTCRCPPPLPGYHRQPRLNYRAPLLHDAELRGCH